MIFLVPPWQPNLQAARHTQPTDILFHIISLTNSNETVATAQLTTTAEEVYTPK